MKLNAMRLTENVLMSGTRITPSKNFADRNKTITAPISLLVRSYRSMIKISISSSQKPTDKKIVNADVPIKGEDISICGGSTLIGKSLHNNRIKRKEKLCT